MAKDTSTQKNPLPATVPGVGLVSSGGNVISPSQNDFVVEQYRQQRAAEKASTTTSTTPTKTPLPATVPGVGLVSSGGNVIPPSQNDFVVEQYRQRRAEEKASNITPTSITADGTPLKKIEPDNNEKPGNPDSSAYWQREKDRQAEQERNTETPSYTPQNTPTQTMPTVPTQTMPTTTSTSQNTLMMNEEEINNLINRIRKAIEEFDSYWSYIKNNCMEKVKNSWVADETKTYVDSVLAEDNNVNKIKESLLLLASTYESVRNNVNNTQIENARYIQNNF